jgi:hypothetical protein
MCGVMMLAATVGKGGAGKGGRRKLCSEQARGVPDFITNSQSASDGNPSDRTQPVAFTVHEDFHSNSDL